MLPVDQPAWRCGHNDMNRSAKAVLLALFLFRLGLPQCGAAAERQNDLRITYSPPRLSLEARGVSLLRALREIGEKVGFELAGY